MACLAAVCRCRSAASQLTLTDPRIRTSAAAEKVAFNTKSLKYHCPQCQARVRCTKNCITTTRAQAEGRGGIPGKARGGTCA